MHFQQEMANAKYLAMWDTVCSLCASNQCSAPTANANVVEGKPGQIKPGLPRFLPAGIQVSHDYVKYLCSPSRIVLGDSHFVVTVTVLFGGLSIISGGI
jgi:hypothetical protein